MIIWSSYSVAMDRCLACLTKVSRRGKEFFCSPEKTKHPLGVRKEHMWSSESRIFPWHFTIIVRENCLFVLLNYAGQLYSQLKVLMKYFPFSRGVHCNFFLLMHSNKKFGKKKVNTIKESLSENVPLRDRNQMYIIMKNTQPLNYHMLWVTSSTPEMSVF